MMPADTEYWFCAAHEATFLFNVAFEDIWVWDPSPIYSGSDSQHTMRESLVN